jgi:hypothetical protein
MNGVPCIGSNLKTMRNYVGTAEGVKKFFEISHCLAEWSLKISYVSQRYFCNISNFVSKIAVIAEAFTFKYLIWDAVPDLYNGVKQGRSFEKLTRIFLLSLGTVLSTLEILHEWGAIHLATRITAVAGGVVGCFLLADVLGVVHTLIQLCKGLGKDGTEQKCKRIFKVAFKSASACESLATLDVISIPLITSSALVFTTARLVCGVAYGFLKQAKSDMQRQSLSPAT